MKMPPNMVPTPSARSPRAIAAWYRRFKLAVGRHDDEQRVGPVRQHDYSTERPEQIAGRPPGGRTEERRKDSNRGLHGGAALVSRTPLRKRRPVVESEPRRVLGDVDVNRRAEEDRGRHQRQQANHVLYPPLVSTSALCSYAGSLVNQTRCAARARSGRDSRSPPSHMPKVAAATACRPKDECAGATGATIARRVRIGDAGDSRPRPRRMIFFYHSWNH